MKNCFRLILFVCILCPAISFADYSYYNDLPAHIKSFQTISAHNSQDIFHFVDQQTENKWLITPKLQQTNLKEFYERFFYPWKQHTNYITVDFLRRYIIGESKFYSRNLGYAENFHHHTAPWFKQILHNMNLARFPNEDKPAIAINNAYIRLFPTMDPHYSKQDQVSGGYPFDDFQMSALWAGTPVRILQTSQDHAWAFVVTPSVSGWVAMDQLALVDQKFITLWETSKFAALIVRKTSLTDVHNIYRFDAYLGSIFPYTIASNSKVNILVPVKDIDDYARYTNVILSDDMAQPIPWAPTAKHFALVIQQFLSSDYGWGGVYFYGDCSGTLKSIFTPFGIWLPRNSQAQAHVAKQMLLEKLSPEARQAAILKYGKPFTTLISIKGHIMLYIGQYNGEVMTFQNVWGFVTMSRTGKMGHDVLGSAVLLPLKLSYGKSAMFPQIDGEDLAMTFLNQD